MATFKKDYFNDNSLDAVWTESYGTGGSGNEAGEYFTIQQGVGYITTSAFNVSGIYQGSIAGDFDVKVFLSDNNFTQSYNNQVGFAVYIDATHYMFIGRYTTSATAFYHLYNNGGTTSTGSGGTATSDVYLRIKRVGSTVTLYRSINGTDWTEATNVALGTGDVQLWLQCGANDVASVLYGEYDAAINFGDEWTPAPEIYRTPEHLSPSGNNYYHSNPPSSTITIANSGDSGTWLNWTAAISAAGGDYYFNAYNAGDPGNWDADPAYVVDGLLSTEGSDNEDGDYLELTGNTYSGSNTSDITKVEVRTYWKNNYDGGATRTIAPYLIPYFNGTNAGDNHGPTPGNYDASNGYPNWSDWYDITSDTNAPATWSWSDVENLDLRLQSNRPETGRMDVYKVELRVTSPSWVSIDPLTGSDHTSAAGDILKVYFDVDGLNRGKHYDAITITDSNATNSPQKVSITLTVQGSASFSESLSDTFTMSDSAGALASFAPETTDTFKLGDSAEGKNQIYIDDITLRWSTGISYTYDTLKLSDSASNTLDVYPSVSETFKLTDSSSVLTTFNISVSETFSMTDSAGISANFTPDASDIFKLSESTAPALSATLSGSDAFIFTDGTSGGMLYPVDASDTLKLSDSDTITVSFNPSASDTIVFSDSVSPILSATVSISDALKLSDSSVGVTTIPLNAADTFKLSDSLSISTAFNASISDSLKMAESITAVTTFITNAADELKMSENLQPVLTVNVSISDALKLSDNTTETVTFITSVSDSFKLSDTVTPVVSFSTSGSDVLIFTDNDSAIKAMHESISDTLKLSDNSDVAAIFNTIISDIFKASDVSTTTQNMVLSVSDSLKFGDISTGERIIHVKMVIRGEEQTYSFVVIPKSYIFTAENKQYSFKSGDKAYHFIINN